MRSSNGQIPAAGHVADDDELRGVGAVLRRVKRTQVVGGQCLHRFGRAVFGRAVAMRGSIEQTGKRQARDRRGVVARLQHVRQQFRPQALEFRGRKRGTQRDVGEKRQRRLDARDRHADADRRRVVRAAEDSVAPRKATSSEISSADRAPAPSSSIAAVMLATPGLPDRIRRRAVAEHQGDATTGTSCISTSRTSRPLASCARCTGGNDSERRRPQRGRRRSIRGLSQRQRRHQQDDSGRDAARHRPLLLGRRRGGQHGQLDASIGRQPGADGRLDIGGRQRLVSREIFGEVVRVAGLGDVAVERIRTAANPFQSVVEVGLVAVDPALDLTGLRRRLAQRAAALRR